MILSMIVAVSENGVIGKENTIPWHLSADLQRFKHLTMGHHLIMGRKTYQSIGRALPGRKMLIISRQKSFRAEGCEVVNSLEEAIRLAAESGDDEAFIAGGASVYAAAMPLCTRIYYTQVHTELEGDTFFPEFDLSEWGLVEKVEFPADLNNEYSFTFMVLNRIQ